MARRRKATASTQGSAVPARFSSSATIRRPGSSIVAKPRRRSSANNVDLPPEIYTLDQERRHDFAEAVAEYDRLIAVYPALGYDIQVLRKVSVAERANWVLASLAR